MSTNDRCHPDIVIGPLYTCVNSTGPQWVIPMGEPPLQSKVMCAADDNTAEKRFIEHLRKEYSKQAKKPAASVNRISDLQTVATVDCGKAPMPAEVVAQLQEMEESIQRRVDAAMAEYRAEKEDQLNNTVSKCIWTVVLAGILCMLTLVISEVVR